MTNKGNLSMLGHTGDTPWEYYFTEEEIEVEGPEELIEIGCWDFVNHGNGRYLQIQQEAK